MSLFEVPVDLFNKDEVLHPALQNFVEEGEHFTMLRHPLVYAVPYSPQMNAHYNAMLEHKKTALKEAEDSGDWSSYIWIHERPHRITAFDRIHDRLDDATFWGMLGTIISDTENMWQHKLLFSKFIGSKRPQRDSIMMENEQRLYKSLPDKFVIYRGHQGLNRVGHSWSLSEHVARKFAMRFNTKGVVVRGLVKKSNTLGLLNGRGEMEIVLIDPMKVSNVLETKPLQRSPEMQKILDLCKNQIKRSYYHGPSHWEAVERNFLKIITPQTDPVVGCLFSYFHDCKRQSDNDDKDHGNRAADFVIKVSDRLKQSLSVTDEQIDTLAFACRHHNSGLTSDNPTIGACWDADRLDLPRVGIFPSLELLSTQRAKERMWRL